MFNYIKKLKDPDFSLTLFLLICLFAWSSWIDINGVFVELPLLVKNSPQGWALPSYLSIVIQLANIGPISYLLLSKCFKQHATRLQADIFANFFIIIIGATASLILAFTWHMTSNINGQEYSTPLIVLTFFLATVDCMSSVTFLPFMANFPQIYITAYYVGSGLSGFLPSIVALVQGIGTDTVTCKTVVKQLNLSDTLKNSNNTSYNDSISSSVASENGPFREIIPIYNSTPPRFSVQIFFFFITGMLMVSLIAFVFLVRIKDRRRISEHEIFDAKAQLAATLELINTECEDMGQKKPEEEKKPINPVPDDPCVNERAGEMSSSSLIFLLFLNALICGLNYGVVPGLLSFACLPYGRNIYHLTLTLSAAVNPLACFLYFFISIKTIKSVSFGALLYVLCCSYTVLIAVTSPCPLMNDSFAGGLIMLIVSVLGVGIANYLQTAISTVLREEGHKALVWCGVSTQVGALVCACAMFPLINIFKVFVNTQDCQQCP